MPTDIYHISPDMYNYAVLNDNSYEIKCTTKLDSEAIIKIIGAWTEVQVCIEEAYNRNKKFNEYSLENGCTVDLAKVSQNSETGHYFAFIDRLYNANEMLCELWQKYQITHIKTVTEGGYRKLP